MTTNQWAVMLAIKIQASSYPLEQYTCLCEERRTALTCERRGWLKRLDKKARTFKVTHKGAVALQKDKRNRIEAMS